MTLRLVTAFVIAAGLAASAMAQTGGTTNMEILRQKIKADKKLVVAENLQLTDAEGTAFWPVYDAYQKELQAINQRLTTTIQAYAQHVQQGTDHQRDGEEAPRRSSCDRRGRGEVEERIGAQDPGGPPRDEGGPLHPDRKQDSGGRPLRAGRGDSACRVVASAAHHLRAGSLPFAKACAICSARDSVSAYEVFDTTETTSPRSGNVMSDATMPPSTIPS